MEHGGALVVHDGPEHARLVLDVTETVAQVHWTLIRIGKAPSAELPQHVGECFLSPGLLRVQRREVLREARAQPLLVIVLAADGLAPPLMRELVREKELREAVE